MPVHSLLDRILPILSLVRDDKEKLEKILHFLETEILPEVEEENSRITIPEAYERIVRDIAERISCGLVCYLNMDTLEMEDYPEHTDPDEWEDMTGEKFEPQYEKWENVLTFEPLPSSAGFRIMENFAEQLDNVKVSNQLVDILSRKKPFAHFNHYIHNSDYREDWFAFKNAAYEEHVRETIYYELNKIDDDEV